MGEGFGGEFVEISGGGGWGAYFIRGGELIAFGEEGSLHSLSAHTEGHGGEGLWGGAHCIRWELKGRFAWLIAFVGGRTGVHGGECLCGGELIAFAGGRTEVHGGEGLCGSAHFIRWGSHGGTRRDCLCGMAHCIRWVLPRRGAEFKCCLSV